MSIDLSLYHQVENMTLYEHICCGLQKVCVLQGAVLVLIHSVTNHGANQGFCKECAKLGRSIQWRLKNVATG